ncbi:MAG: hypothetical protein IT161_24575 [Bryobacterales bacterium]|nr:hypothetical protein [Bryobacterales bacterium]
MPDNSTATARCVADDSFLYLGVSISANPLRFETMPFNQAWRNDAVEVFLSSRAAGPSAHIGTGLLRVSSDSMGRAVTEGSISVRDGAHTTRKFSYPLLWEASGVRTGLQVVPSGYSVEVAIPRHSIGWTETAAAPGLSINVRVRRTCGQKPCPAVMQTSDDPYNASPEGDELYRPMSLGRVFRTTNRPSASRPDGEATGALVYGALLRLDAFDSDGAVALLRESQDRRLLPIAGIALLARGHLESARSVLGNIGSGEIGDGVRVWVRETRARTHALQGASSLAEGEYAVLAASTNPVFQDIGVAGLIDLALAEGKGDAALATYNAAFGGPTAPGMRSASRIAVWLEKQARVAESVNVLNRLAESEWADDSERAWALLQLQSLSQRNGDIEHAAATGWRLQALAPSGDPSGEAGLKKLIAMMNFGRITTVAAPAFSESYRRFLDANPGATDPARRIAYAAQLWWEGKSDAATELYNDISSELGARRKDRAAALLNLQRLHLESGHVERSVETGLAIQDVFPEDVRSRLASWQLMHAANAAGGVPISLDQQVQKFERALARDIRGLADDSIGAAQRSAQALLIQFEKELNQR